MVLRLRQHNIGYTDDGHPSVVKRSNGQDTDHKRVDSMYVSSLLIKHDIRTLWHEVKNIKRER